jgi:membrane associated rhomboid family serine protease
MRRWLRTLTERYPKMWVWEAASAVEQAWNEPMMVVYAPIFLSNLGVFLAWRLGFGVAVVRRVLNRYFLLTPQRGRVVPLSLLLSTFSHGTPLHFGFNMWAIYTFLIGLPAYHAEDVMALYLTAGSFSALVSLCASVVGRRTVRSLGASGAALWLASWVRAGDTVRRWPHRSAMCLFFSTSCREPDT